MDIRPVELTDDAALAAAYAVECAATRRVRPGWTPLGEAARVLGWRAADGWDRHIVGAFDRGLLIGVATAMTARDTPDTTWINVVVHPRDQRTGVGSLLARDVERRSPVSASRFVASAYRPTPDDIEHLVTAFAQPLGYSRASTETVVELDLVSATFSSPAPPVGYVVSTHVNGVPARLRTQVGVLKGMVDSEAPSGDLEWEPTPVTAEEYDTEIALWRQQGRTAIESIALDRLGNVAAWTCLVVTADLQRPAQIEGTLVLAEHRGQRLGAVVKSACLSAARDHGGTTRVRTSSDDENTWMRAINRDLGFVPVELEVVLQKTAKRPRTLRSGASRL